MFAKRQRGFTVIEVIVATAIVSIGILSTVTVAAMTVKAGESNERTLVATNLAREGIESVRSIRDSNWQILADQAARQAAGLGGPNSKTAADWDCYPGSETAATGSPLPFACDGHLSTIPANARKNFSVSAGTATNVPALIERNATNTDNALFLICLRSTGVYAFAANPSTDCIGKQYYRRVEITGQQKQLDGTYSFRVRSFVTWPERAAKGQPDIGIAEYLTDWKK